MHFRRSAAVVIALLLLSLGPPAHAAGFTDAITPPVQSIAAAIEGAVTQLIAIIGPHHAVTVQIAAAPWHAAGRSAAAVVFNTPAETVHPQHTKVAAAPPAEPPADAQLAAVATPVHI